MNWGLGLALGFLCIGLLVIAWAVMRRPEFWIGLVIAVLKPIKLRKLTPDEKAKAIKPGDDGFKGQPQTKPVTTGKVIIKRNPPAKNL